MGFAGVLLFGDGLIKSIKNDFRVFLDLTTGCLGEEMNKRMPLPATTDPGTLSTPYVPKSDCVDKKKAYSPFNLICCHTKLLMIPHDEILKVKSGKGAQINQFTLLKC